MNIENHGTVNDCYLNDICNRFLDETMEMNDLPGLAIGVSAADEVFTGARGYRNHTFKEPLFADDIFHCASISKLFTSTAVMLLVEAGVLNLYDRLCDLMPDLKISDVRYREIRLWNLLTHTSGLGDVQDYHWDSPETDDGALRRYVYGSPEVTDQRMLWAPQTAPEFYGCDEKKFSYSNIAYEILGQIVSEYSCKMPDAPISDGAETPLAYEDFIDLYIFRPTGMSSSTMKTFARTAPNTHERAPMAAPHEKEIDRSIRTVRHYPYTRQHAPSSTLTSNTSDLLRWGQVNISRSKNIVLQNETYDSVWRNYATVPNNGEKMGLGWFIRRQLGHTLYGHEGTDDGFRASFWICPELNTVCVVLSNLSGAPVKKINKKLFAHICESLL